MGKVSVEQLRERLKSTEERRKYYEWKSGQPGKLSRHEVWRHAYLAKPYLIGASDEGVDERFRHVFMNFMELGGNGKLTPVMPSETEEFAVTFTHLLEEFETRGTGIQGADSQSAGAPFKRYFEHGTPIGVRLFDGYPRPAEKILVKYGKKEFLEPMWKGGEIRLSNAKSYANSNHIDSIRDDETSRFFCIPTYKERLDGKVFLDFQGHRFEFGDDDIVLPLVFEDYYLFSLCEKIHYRMPTDFDSDAAIIIKDPVVFTQRVISSFLSRLPGWRPMEGAVTYYDPYQDFDKFKIPQMAKHFGYAYQKEFRIAFVSDRKIEIPLEPRFISIGSMTDYADLVTL